VSIGTLLAVGLTWLLVGAPWTSLVWTSGRALRYVLPVLLLGWFVVLLALFPLSLPWYQSGRGRLAGTAIIALASSGIAWMAVRPPEQDAGRHLLLMTPWAPLVGLMLTAAWVGARATIRASASRAAAAAATVTVLVAGAVVTAMAARAATISLDGAAAPVMAQPCPAPAAASEHEGAARLIAEHERRLPPDGARRRVYLTARFDAPLALQGPTYDALVYDVRLSRLDDRMLRRVQPGSGTRDYVVSPASQDDHAFLAALAAQGELVDLGTTRTYRVWYVPPRPPAP
jgi:hypothetical protein